MAGSAQCQNVRLYHPPCDRVFISFGAGPLFACQCRDWGARESENGKFTD